MSRLAKLGLLCIGSALASFAQPATTTVADTLYAAIGGPTYCSGTITLTWNTFYSKDGYLIQGGTSAPQPVTAGAFSIAVVPTNTNVTPAAGLYTIRYNVQPSGCAPATEYWNVPSSMTPVDLNMVRTLPTPPPSLIPVTSLYPPLTGTQIPLCYTNGVIQWTTDCAGSGLSAVTATFNTSMGTCTTSGGTGTNSCTAATGSVVITHNLGTSTPFATFFNASSSSTATLIVNSSNQVTFTFSGDITGTAAISTGGSGAQGATGATGATGPAGTNGTNGTNGAISQIYNNGTSKPVEPYLNLISGTNATVSCADNSGATRTDCTVNSTGGGSSVTALPPYLEIGSTLYIPSDNMYQATIPNLASYAAIGGTSAPTVATNTNGDVTLTAAGYSLYADPSHTTSIEMVGRVLNLTNGNTGSGGGIFFCDSTNSKILYFVETESAAGALQLYSLTATSNSSCTTFSYSSTQFIGAVPVGQGALHLKGAVSGTTLTFSYVLNGTTPVAVQSYTVGTISKMGYAVANTSSDTTVMEIFSGVVN